MSKFDSLINQYKSILNEGIGSSAPDVFTPSKIKDLDDNEFDAVGFDFEDDYEPGSSIDEVLNTRMKNFYNRLEQFRNTYGPYVDAFISVRPEFKIIQNGMREMWASVRKK